MGERDLLLLAKLTEDVVFHFEWGTFFIVRFFSSLFIRIFFFSFCTRLAVARVHQNFAREFFFLYARDVLLVPSQIWDG
jgi:hypothetical protein